jgi:glycosyltransferase involved in cell wall biosynthesis
MRIDIVIPTYDRAALLRKAIHSLEQSTYEATAILIIDGNPNYEKDLVFGKLPMIIHENAERRDWVASMNSWLKSDGKTRNPDAVFYAADDLEFSPQCIEFAVAAMNERFPNGDGLVGINQQIPGGRESAFGLMGRRFIERFPDGIVFCPDYVHWWSDFELGEYARSINRFFWCKMAKVRHNRPHDKTYRLAHEPIHRDHAAHKERERRRLLWGRNFDLVTVNA